MEADPAFVSCDIPSRWMPEQRGAAVSQNSTWPVVTGWPASITRAIKVTTLPAVKVVTALPADVPASVVVVSLVAQAGPGTPCNSIKPARNVITGDVIRRNVALMQGKARLQDADEESIGRCSSHKTALRFKSAALRKGIRAHRKGTGKGTGKGNQR